ncbi:TPA: hypothetical protein ROX98_001002 [Bacillus pseudomycoides]|nr:hypothetical protein [Bacillus pseudomycoides]
MHPVFILSRYSWAVRPPTDESFTLLQISLDWITFHIADEWIDDVTISNTAELLIVLFFFTLDKIWLTDKKEK